MDTITLAIGVAITVATVLLAMVIAGPLNRLTWRLILKRSRSAGPSSARSIGTASEQRNGASVARSQSESDSTRNEAPSAQRRKN